MSEPPHSAPPFHLLPPGAPRAPLILSSPHSGDFYPPAFLASARLDRHTLRRSEDAFVHELFDFAPSLGVPLLRAVYARAYLDLNREPYELDPAMFMDPLPAFVRKQSERIAAGLGALPRVVGQGLDIYPGKLAFAEARQRIETIHHPFHAALTSLVEEARTGSGAAILIDCHSMPSQPPLGVFRRLGRRPPDVVLGDCHGASCAPRITNFLRNLFERQGFTVAINQPYAGGFTTTSFGKPARGVHAIQIEIDRALYMDEVRIEKTAGFDRMRESLAMILKDIVAAWQVLVGERPWPVAAE